LNDISLSENGERMLKYKKTYFSRICTGLTEKFTYYPSFSLVLYVFSVELRAICPLSMFLFLFFKQIVNFERIVKSKIVIIPIF